MVGGGRVGRGKLLCPTIQTSVNFVTLTNYIFASFQQITSKLRYFTNSKTFFFFRGVDGFSLTFQVTGLKKTVERSIQ